MSGDELTPDRLDAILDGREAPQTDAERDMLALAASLREAAPRADEALRLRVRELGAPQPGGRRRRLTGSGWRGRALVAAPALAAVAAAVVAVGVLSRDSNSGPTGADSSLATRTATLSGAPAGSAAKGVESAPGDQPSVTAGTPAPTPASPRASVDAATAAAVATIRVAAGSLDARVADVRRIVAAAGGAATIAGQAPGDAGVLIRIALPPDRAATALAAVAKLGAGAPVIAIDPDGRTQVRLVEAPG